MNNFSQNNFHPSAVAAGITAESSSRPSRTIDFRALWNAEYMGQGSIPSSHRAQAAHALQELAKQFDFSSGRILDIGCGNGRNSIFLANAGMRVTALDFSEAALDLLARSRCNDLLRKNIEPIIHDLNNALPFEDECFDMILDSYCLCHFTNVRSLQDVMAECRRVLKPGGVVIKIHLDNKDQYYLERSEKATEFGHISYDPSNGLRKLHCDEQSYMKLVGAGFDLAKVINVGFLDRVQGKEYLRSVLVSVMRKI